MSDLVRIHYFNGEYMTIEWRELIHKTESLGIYRENDYYCITTLSGYGVASRFRCLTTAKLVVKKLSKTKEWNTNFSHAIKLHATISRKYSNVADFAYMWSKTAKEFKEKFNVLIKSDILMSGH
jgi:hypothetical protein